METCYLRLTFLPGIGPQLFPCILWHSQAACPAITESCYLKLQASLLLLPGSPSLLIFALPPHYSVHLANSHSSLKT